MKLKINSLFKNLRMKKKTITVEQEKSELISKAVEMMKQGHNAQYIKKQLHEISLNKFTVEEITNCISEAAAIVTQSYFNTGKDIRLLHLKRYNKEINRLLNVSELDESDIGKTITYKQFLSSRNRKIKAFDKALDSMNQLETLLGLSSITNTVDVNSEVTINVNEVNSKKYDFSKLTLEEKVELLELMQKAKLGRSEPGGVLETNIEQENIIEDIDSEIVPANVELIKQVAPTPSPEYKSQEKTSVDVLQKLKERLSVAVAKRFEAIGGNLDQKEKNIIANE